MSEKHITSILNILCVYLLWSAFSYACIQSDKQSPAPNRATLFPNLGYQRRAKLRARYESSIA